MSDLSYGETLEESSPQERALSDSFFSRSTPTNNHF